MNEESVDPKPNRTSKVKVRVIGAGSSRLGAKPSDQSNQDEQEVVKLGGQEPLQLTRSVDDLEKVQTNTVRESKKTRKERKRKSRITFWMAVITVVVIILGVAAVLLARLGQEENLETYGGVVLDDSNLSVDSQLDADEIAAQDTEARRLAETISNAASWKDVLPLVRDDGEQREWFKQRWQKLELDGVEADSFRLERYVEGDSSWIATSVRDLNSNPVTLVFVSVEGKLYYDWAASFGEGEVAVEDLESVKEDRVLEMRLQIEDNFIPGTFPVERSDSYRLSSPFSVKTFWGYVEPRSAIDLEIGDMLNQGSAIFERQAKASIVVRLRNRGEANQGRFEIVEVVNRGWVKP